MSLVKKMSIKTLVPDLKKLVASEEIKKTTPIVRIIGRATKAQTGESDYGAWVAFIGQFKATNLLTGEESVSAKLFLPDVAADMIEGTLAEEGVTVVEFGFDILVTPNAESAVGYIFEANSLIAPKESDPLVALGNKIDKALASPKK